MKITWKPREGVTGGSTVVIGDNTASTRGPGTKLIVSARPAFQALTQSAGYPGAEMVETFGRGNMQCGVNVAVLYEFRTFGECTKFTFDLGNLLQVEGVLEVAHAGGGAAAMEGVFTSAEVTLQDGASAAVNYVFAGGRFSRGQSTNIGVGIP